MSTHHSFENQRSWLGDFTAKDYIVMKALDAEALFFIAYWYYLMKSKNKDWKELWIDLKATSTKNKTDFFYTYYGKKRWVDFELDWDRTINKFQDFDSNNQILENNLWILTLKNSLPSSPKAYSYFQYKQCFPKIIFKKLLNLEQHNNWIAILNNVQNFEFRKELLEFDRLNLQSTVYNKISNVKDRVSLMKLVDIHWFAIKTNRVPAVKNVLDFVYNVITDRMEDYDRYNLMHGYFNYRTTMAFKEYFTSRNRMQEIMNVVKAYHSWRGTINNWYCWSWSDFIKCVPNWLGMDIYKFMKTIPILNFDFKEMSKIFKERYEKRLNEFYYWDSANKWNWGRLFGKLGFWLIYEKSYEETEFDKIYQAIYDEFKRTNKLTDKEQIREAFGKYIELNKGRFTVNWKTFHPVSEKMDYPLNIYLVGSRKIKDEFVKEFKF